MNKPVLLALFASLVACSAAPAEQQASQGSRLSDGRTRPVTIEMGAFIPCEGLNAGGGLGLFDGDNRIWFDDSGNPHSAFAWGNFDLDRNRTALRTRINDSYGNVDQEGRIHESVRYDQHNGGFSTLGGDLGWCATFDANRPAETNRGRASSENIYAQVLGSHITGDDREPGSTSYTALYMRAAGPNGATSFPEWAVPSIQLDCNVDIFYRPDDSGIEQPIRIDYACSNTKFPSIEVYIDGHPVVLQDVLVEKRDPNIDLTFQNMGGNHGSCRWNDGIQSWDCHDT